MYLKIEFLTFIFFILFIIIHELYYKRTVTIKFDSRIIFIFYIFVSAFFAKIAYPETIVWPVGEHALSTNLENVFKDLILLKESNTYLKQSFFVILPIVFFIFLSKFSKLEKIYALNFYILVLFFICSLNLIILVLIYLLPDYLSTFDYFFEEILKINIDMLRLVGHYIEFHFLLESHLMHRFTLFLYLHIYYLTVF